MIIAFRENGHEKHSTPNKYDRTDLFSQRNHAYPASDARGWRVPGRRTTLPDGLPLAIVPTNYGGDVAAAIAAMLRKVSDRAQSQLGMGEVDEVAIRDCNHTRLACRHIPDGKGGMILAVIVPAGPTAA